MPPNSPRDDSPPRDEFEWSRLLTFWKGVKYPPGDRYTAAHFRAVGEDHAADIVKAYYAALLGSAEAVRSHAQAGSAIASGAAALVFGAGVLGDVDEARWYIKLLGLLTLILWLITAYRFMAAVAAHGTFSRPERGGRMDRDMEPESQARPEEFARRAIALIRNERRVLIQDAWYARLTAGAAMLLTVITLILVLFAGTDAGESVQGTVVMSRESTKALTRCDVSPGTRVAASVDKTTLGDALVSFTVTRGTCAGRTLWLPTEAVGVFLKN